MRNACDETEAYCKGYSDYGTERACDFEPNTQEHKDWVEGFNDRHSEMFADSNHVRKFFSNSVREDECTCQEDWPTHDELCPYCQDKSRPAYPETSDDHEDESS